MSIATELQNLNDNILDAYDAVQDKGGTVPANKNMVNLPTAITAIPSGGGDGIPREVDANGVFRDPEQPFVFSLPANATEVRAYALSRAFYNTSQVQAGSSGLTEVNLPNVSEIGYGGVSESFFGCYYLQKASFPLLTRANPSAFSGAFRYCHSLTDVDLHNLSAISGDAFRNAFSRCSSLTDISFPAYTNNTGSDSSVFYRCFDSCDLINCVAFPNLVTVSGSNVFEGAFQYCPSLSVNPFPKIETASGGYCLRYVFDGCTSLQGITFQYLSNISGNYALAGAFRNCTSLTSVSFPALTTSSFGTRTNQFNNMLQGVTGCTVHFPAAIQSTIGSWADVTAGFGGTNTTVLFDL